MESPEDGASDHADSIGLRSSGTTAPILELPTELLHMMSSGLHYRDLRNLRGTCKAFHGVFTGRYFQKRRWSLAHQKFTLTEPGLQILLDMTANAQLCIHIQTIMFSTFRFAKWGARVNVGSDYRREELKAAHRAFTLSGGRIQMIAQSLENIKKANNVKISLGIFDDDDYRSPNETYVVPQGKGHGFRASFGTRIAGSADSEETLCVLVAAIALSKPSVETIRVKLSLRLAMIHAPMLNYKQPTMKQLLAPESKAFSSDVRVIYRSSRYRGTIRISSRGGHLEIVDLDLGFETDDEHKRSASSSFLQAIHSAPFRKVTIRRSSLDADDFRMLVELRKNSLRQLKLINIDIVSHHRRDRMQFLRYLRNALNLEDLSLGEFNKWPPRRKTWRFGRHKTYHWNGEGNIRAGLDDTISTIRRRGYTDPRVDEASREWWDFDNDYPFPEQTDDGAYAEDEDTEEELD